METLPSFTKGLVITFYSIDHNLNSPNDYTSLCTAAHKNLTDDTRKILKRSKGWFLISPANLYLKKNIDLI